MSNAQDITLYIGIDPDVDKSGVATWNGKALTIDLMRFFDLYEFMQGYSPSYQDGRGVFVRIEAGWLNKGMYNRHEMDAAAIRVGRRIAKNTGENHQVGKKIAEMCEYLNIKYELIKPVTRKWTPEQFKLYTGMETKNQEMIDAAALIHQLPMRRAVPWSSKK